MRDSGRVDPLALWRGIDDAVRRELNRTLPPARPPARTVAPAPAAPVKLARAEAMPAARPALSDTLAHAHAPA